MTDEPHVILLRPPLRNGCTLLSTYLDRAEEEVSDELGLRPDEGLIVELRAQAGQSIPG